MRATIRIKLVATFAAVIPMLMGFSVDCLSTLTGNPRDARRAVAA
ncbi:hypothetical protein [Sphingomonas yabuuchiae]